ncbi:MAG: hypothetical protein H0U55_11885 [Rubrobacteraceae bacterium]|nr:hypothetical protein [Rubrobacteraceae bacterium]
MKTTKIRIVLLLAVVMLTVFSITGPALAQGATQTSVPYKGQVVAAPGGSGTPLKLETATKKISGTAGQYVKLPAKITNISNRPVKDAVAYTSLVDVTKGQQAPVDLEDWSAHRAITISSLAPGQSRDVSWSLRLVKGGNYTVYANAIVQGSTRASVGQEVPLFVQTKQNLNPGGVLPVALGVPILAGAALIGPVFLRRRNLAV